MPSSEAFDKSIPAMKIDHTKDDLKLQEIMRQLELMNTVETSLLIVALRNFFESGGDHP